MTLDDIKAALIYAHENNPNEHGAETEFVGLMKRNPLLLPARAARSERVMRLLGGQGAMLADIGAGICLNSVLAIYNGAREIHAVEMESSRYVSAQMIIERLGLKNRIHLHTVDVLTLDLPSESLDGGFSAEFLEHISDLPLFYATFYRWLKPGKCFYARTGANGFGWEKKRTFPAIWDRLDKRFQVMRAGIAVAILGPDKKQTAIEIADRTRGLLVKEVEFAVRQYQQTGEMPKPQTPRPPRDPYTGQYMERLLNPYESIKQMDAAGFKTKLLRPDFSGMTVPGTKRFAYRAAGELIKWTHPLSLPLAPWLEFLSCKPRL